MLYSIKMRAAQGGDHKLGGQHISGAERILAEENLKKIAEAMIERALLHSRGKADFINLKIEAIRYQDIERIKLLPIFTHEVDTIQEGRKSAIQILKESGVSTQAILAGLHLLEELKMSMRGAMIVDAVSGKRLDQLTMRGVRVSKMDIEDEEDFLLWLNRQKLTDIHVREAVVLATKVVSHQDVTAELCWSDDPEYVTGYVANKTGYHQITKLKEYGSFIGGRVFFVKPDAAIEEVIDYLQNQPVLAIGRGE